MSAGDMYPRPSREEIAARHGVAGAERTGLVGPERTVCACGHQRGTHMAGDPRPCEMSGCGCGKFRAATANSSPEPPVVVQGVVEPEPEPTAAPDPLACFSVHLSARMRALGWDQTRLQERAGISPHVAAKAINGNGCDLAVAGKIAAVVGGHLATMIGPYICATCAGEPPQGYGCLECGTETRAAS